MAIIWVTHKDPIQNSGFPLTLWTKAEWPEVLKDMAKERSIILLLSSVKSKRQPGPQKCIDLNEESKIRKMGCWHYKLHSSVHPKYIDIYTYTYIHIHTYTYLYLYSYTYQLYLYHLSSIWLFLFVKLMLRMLLTSIERYMEYVFWHLNFVFQMKSEWIGKNCDTWGDYPDTHDIIRVLTNW